MLEKIGEIVKLVKITVKKVLSVLPNSILGILGVAQAVVKFIKEVCTLAIDLLSPVIPKVDTIVALIRSKINVVDYWLEQIKNFILKFKG